MSDNNTFRRLNYRNDCKRNRHLEKILDAFYWMESGESRWEKLMYWAVTQLLKTLGWHTLQWTPRRLK
ncbi:hypothetical protein THIOSC15_670009 [uncultured Thiomicrorhabdus sp.]